MASRSLNKVQLIGNLTRDPELRYTPQGTAVCSFGLATNRQWTTEDGEKREDAEFHTVVAWNRLAEICSEYLKKGSQAYIDGRLSTREWEGQDGVKRRTTEVIANEVIFLSGGARREDLDIPTDLGSGKPKLEGASAAGHRRSGGTSGPEESAQASKPRGVELDEKKPESEKPKGQPSTAKPTAGEESDPGEDIPF